MKRKKGGIDDIMSMLSEKIVSELRKEPVVKQPTFQDIVKRLLIGFFVLMILLSFIARAADSVTVAKVKGTFTNRGKLCFDIEGTGRLEEKAERYMDIYQGIRIEKVYVKEGERVKKGDRLLRYDMNDLEDVKNMLQDELKKAQITYEKNRLSYEEGKVDSAYDTAKIALERSKLDLETAKEDLKTAKRQINKERKSDYEKALKEYNKELEIYSDMEESKEKELNQAEQAIVDASESLDGLYDKKRKAEAVLDNYKTVVLRGDNTAVKTEETNILKAYYGESGYEEHLNAIEKAKQGIKRAKEDYWNAVVDKSLNGDLLTISEQTTYNRAISDAEDVLTKLTKKDNELTQLIANYSTALKSNLALEIEKTYTVLLSWLYKEDEETIKNAKNTNKIISQAQKAYDERSKEWDKKLIKAQKALNEAQKESDKVEEVYDQILNHTYDYSLETKTEERLITAAKRAVEDAKIALKEAKEEESDATIKSNTNKQISDLELKLGEIDIKEKEEAVENVRKIMDNHGDVMSTEKGIVLKIGVEVGLATTGTEKVSIATDDYSFKAKVTKEEGKRLEVGDAINLKIGNRKEEIKISIDSISMEDSDGNILITGILPQGDYKTGASVSFAINKQSKEYQQTIPIQSLRMSSNGKYYVLITQENNTILGDELVATCMYINLLDKDYKTAAIEGNLYRDSYIIESSSKNIEDGDRVRINDQKEE